MSHMDDIPPEMTPLGDDDSFSVARERDDLKERLQRLAADYENHRRRSRLEKEQAALVADSKLVAELLSVVDDFDRAIEHATHADPALVSGLDMTYRRLVDVLTRHGLRAISTDGQFDPHLHEAVALRAGSEDGLILEVIQRGYCIGERVIRHAKVIVSST